MTQTIVNVLTCILVLNGIKHMAMHVVVFCYNEINSLLLKSSDFANFTHYCKYLYHSECSRGSNIKVVVCGNRSTIDVECQP